MFDLDRYRRLRDANGLRLYEEEIARNQVLLDEARLERKRTNLKNWLKVARLHWTGDGSWERDLEIKLADKTFREEDAAGRGRIRFIYENIQRVEKLKDALVRQIARDGAA